MRLALNVAAVGVYVPDLVRHSSLLGTVSQTTYNHLFVAAGVHSRPPTVPRGATAIWCDPYDAPAAPVAERTSDLASHAVGELFRADPGAPPHVRAIFHAQCTLDQQMLGSACLRVQHDHCADAQSAITIGQLGTAAIPTAARLAAIEVAGGGLACLSASDKWMAPFFRRVPGLVTYGDAAGACLVGTAEIVTAPIAVIEAVVTSCRPPVGDLWTAPAEQQSQEIFEHTHACVERLLAECGELDRATLAIAGDGYGEAMLARLGEASGIGGERIEGSSAEIHLASASPLAALRAAVAAAVGLGRQTRVVIWAASPAGHAAAMLVRCQPDAVQTAAGWSTAVPFVQTATDRGTPARTGRKGGKAT